MRRWIWLVVVGCQSEKAELADSKNGPSAADTSDTAVDTAADTGIDPTDSEWAGIWSGPLTMEVQVWSWVLCEGSAELVVDAEGAMEGSVECRNPDSGQVYPLTLTGELDSEGFVQGDTTFEFVYEDGQTSTFLGIVWGAAGASEMALGLQTNVTDEEGEPFIVVNGLASLER